MITHEQEKYGWEFLFLGANIDAAEIGSRMGIHEDRTATYLSDSEGTSLNYEVISDAVSELRACSALPEGWKDRIDADRKKRRR